MASRKRATAFKYPGRLGRRSTTADLLPAFRDALRQFNAAHPNATKAQIDRWAEHEIEKLRGAHLSRLMNELQICIGIDLNDSDAARELAWFLAMAHVPAFQFADTVKRGRPAKLRNRLAQLSGLRSAPKSTKPAKVRGAPKIWATEREATNLLRHLEEGKNKLRVKGKKVTNLAALIEYAESHRRAGTAGFGSWSSEDIRAEARRRAARISDARKALRKISKESP